MSETRTPTVLKPHGVAAALKARWLTVLVLVVALAVFVGWFRNAFYDTGYAPEQPIHYSHKLHAGDLKIDCKYCHFNAERGKHAGIPPSSVCLGCHGPQNGAIANDKPEVQKLLAYINNEQGSYKDEATGIIHEGGAVHWKRVHKLPDFVYFSHQWHVRAGVSCQTCHGPIENMTVVRQYAPLTMGWCIDCHRNTNYVGGRSYDHKDPATFEVGTANYDVLRLRIKPDAVAEFIERPTKANDSGHAAHAGDGDASRAHAHAHADNEPIDRPFGSHGAITRSQQRKLDDLLTRYPQLKDVPAWRVVDLPASHRQVYQELIAEAVELAKRAETYPKNPAEAERFELDLLQKFSFQNAPTQCSTCHQ